MSTIVTRAGKGSPLTHVEVDANFTNLNTDKVEKTSADITGGTINGTTIGATTASTGRFSDLTDTGLTSGRVTYASTGGNLVDSANLTFNGTTLVANDITDSSLIATRVVYAGTGGNLVNASNFTYDGTNLVAGAIQNTPIGATTPAAGKFTTLESTGTGSFGTTSAQYIQAVGNATEPQILAVGSGTNIPLVLQPKGTGAIQAQATTSTTAGGNARGANAVDWQTERDIASRVASATSSVVSGGSFNTASSQYGVVAGGGVNTTSGFAGVVSGGYNNTASGIYAGVGGGQTNTASGYYGFVGNGFTNSTTSNSAVTTQSGTMNATTAVTLSGSNANIKVGQYITGTSIAGDTYVAAISGTSLTLSKNASGSSTSTLSFFTPHGVVVGGGNNQATGSYSFIGGGGDAGTAANRNVASGDWSTVAGGFKNTASGLYSTVTGGYNGIASGYGGTVLGGASQFNANANTASGNAATILGGAGNSSTGYFSNVVGGESNTANSSYSYVSGSYGITRGITGNVSYGISYGFGTYSQGKSQYSFLGLYAATTNNTATRLTSDGNAASGINQVILPNNSASYFMGEVISGVTGGGNTKGWYIEGVIKRGANAASTALVGTPTVTSNYADAGASTWTIAVTADTTNGGLAVTFTGQAGTTIRTVCSIKTTEMAY